MKDVSATVQFCFFNYKQIQGSGLSLQGAAGRRDGPLSRPALLAGLSSFSEALVPYLRAARPAVAPTWGEFG